MQSNINLTVLVDNQASDGLEVEHGFAAWIDTGDQQILFDTGAGRALLTNAQHLGVDLRRANALVLSHGHYDHTGGLAQFLAMAPEIRLFFGQGMAVSRCSCHPGVPPRDIGIRPDDYRALLAVPPCQVRELHAPYYLAPGIGLTGPIPRKHPDEDTGGPFFMDASKQHADLLTDDLALWFETCEGLVIVTGCCHSGLLNTVDYIRQVSGQSRVSGIVGGLHLLHASAERMSATIAGLIHLQLDFLIPTHCTGPAQALALQDALGKDVVQPGSAGMTIHLGCLQ